MVKPEEFQKYQILFMKLVLRVLNIILWHMFYETSKELCLKQREIIKENKKLIEDLDVL